MTEDERAIRQLIDDWVAASKTGDVQAVLSLMTDDVIFMVPGQKPFGKAAFAAASEGMKNIALDVVNYVQEIRVFGEWGYLRNYLDLTVTTAGGIPVRRCGYTLSILHKESDGRWRLSRDANLVTVQQ